jgi:hypothetical protein
VLGSGSGLGSVVGVRVGLGAGRLDDLEAAEDEREERGDLDEPS